MKILNTSIICNNCLGARFYKEHGYEFNNPFMWNCIEPIEFIKLIKTWDNIDLNNPKFELVKTNSKEYVNAIIGDNINFNYIHYLYDESKKTPIKIYADILYADILNYAKYKYFERLNRMPKDKIFMFNTAHFLNEEHFSVKCNGDFLLDEINELAKTNNIIVILDSLHKYNINNINFKLIYCDNIYGKSALDILNKDNYLDKLIYKYIYNNKNCHHTNIKVDKSKEWFIEKFGNFIDNTENEQLNKR